MSLLGTPEIAALTCDEKLQCVYGVRLRQKKRSGYEIVKYASSEHASWQRAADAVLKELAVNNSVYLVLAIQPEQSEVFEASLPQASSDVMREALRFEVPRQLLSVPEDFRLQFVQITYEELDEELLPEELSNQQGQLPLKGVKVVIQRNSDQKEVASIIVDRFSYEENNP